MVNSLEESAGQASCGTWFSCGAWFSYTKEDVNGNIDSLCHLWGLKWKRLLNDRFCHSLLQTLLPPTFPRFNLSTPRPDTLLFPLAHDFSEGVGGRGFFPWEGVSLPFPLL